MNNIVFEGSAVALITPFKNGKVDYPAMKNLIERQIKDGTQAIVVLGTTGEPPTLSVEEKRTIIEFAVKQIKGRAKVIAGTGGNDTKKVIEDSLFAKAAGVDALLIVTPYYNKCTQNGLLAHYNAILNKVKHPIILYNVPGRTNVNMLPATVALLAENKFVAGIKEACGNIDQICELAIKIKNKTALYSGDDATLFPLLCVGGRGVISVSANIIPKQMQQMCAKFLAGDIDGARAIHESVYVLNKALFTEVNPIPVKTLAAHLGLIKNELRLPLTPMETASEQKLIKVWEEFKNAKQ